MVNYKISQRTYFTSKIPVEFDKWYKVQINFEQSSRMVRYYLDEVLIGEYSLLTVPDTVKVNLGIYSEDDVKLTLNK